MLDKIVEAIDRIRKLECPAGEVENSVALILEDYGVADKESIAINRDNSLDRDEAKGYRVKIEGGKQSIVVLSQSGYDGYVAKVVDAYRNSNIF